MKRRRPSRPWILAVAATAIAAGYLAYNALGQTTAVVHFDLEANPRVVDEGELVEFEILNSQYFDPVTGEPLELPPVIGDIVWDFDDGSAGSSGPDFHTSHRFADNRVGGYEVGARILSSRNWVKVKVENVPPEIYDILRTRPALQQEPVEFKALARDPGVNDKLTYKWEFGDGGTATGQHVEHTYVANGTYQVTVTVDDGDGGSDTETFSIPIGDVGSFTVTGQISLGEVEIENVILSATTANPFDRKPTDPCLFKIDMFGGSDKAMFTLSATLVPGLGQRPYAIGSTAEWAGMHKDEASSPGIFFAELGLPREIGVRNIGGRHVGGPFWGRGGKVSVDYFDGDYFEMRFRADVVENIPPSFGPRRAHVQGVVAQSVQSARGETTGAMLGSVFGGKFYFCGRDESEFDIAEREPSAEAINVDFLNPKIEVTFTEEVDPRSIQGNLTLEYKGKSGFKEVPGDWRPVPGDPTSVEFIPQARLKQGTIHCLRVETEKEGVRGKEGELLGSSIDPFFSDATRPACESDSMVFGRREWAFSTRPEIKSAKVDVYQASVAGDGTPLVPGKPAVSRVYVDWSDPADVDKTAMVASIPARATVLAHNDSPVYAPKPKATIKRPSLFTADDKKNAKNSINFFNWRPIGNGSMTLKAVIEPLDENDEPVTEFEGSETQLERWDQIVDLTFEYRFIELEVDYPQICQGHLESECQEGCEGYEGEGGIEACINTCVVTNAQLCVAELTSRYGPEEALEKEFGQTDYARGTWLASEGARFTTQNFPVVKTTAAGGMPLTVQLSGMFGLELDDEVAAQLYNSAAGSTEARVLVGYVQPGLLPGATGTQFSWKKPGQRVILLELGQATSSVFAHEMGHFFKLNHCPRKPGKKPPCPPPTPQIQGFRVSPSGEMGFNKHKLEGNQEANTLVPLMKWKLPTEEQVFIKRADYQRLFSTIASPPGQSEAWRIPTHERDTEISLLAALLRPKAAWAQAAGPAETVLEVSGMVGGDSIHLSRVREIADAESLSTPEPGPITLELLDGSGGVMRSISFAATPSDRWHGDPEDPSHFQLVVPSIAGLDAVRVIGPDSSQVTRKRSPSPPTVEAEATTEPSGQRRLKWSPQDTDGDSMLADVFLRADGEGPWRGVAVASSGTEMVLEARDLPAGKQVTARIVVSDGFNTASTDVDLGPGAPLGVLTVSPADGSTGVPHSLDVTVWVSNPLAESDALVVPLPKGSFRLTGPDGEEVFADIAYQPGTNVLTLTPVEPLLPATRYTATLEGLEDLWGNHLAEPRAWSFTTQASEGKEASD